MRAVLAPFMAVLAVWAVWDFPVAPLLVAGVSLVYLLLLWHRPHSWLLVLPALVPVYELGSWSGRVLVTELDILVLITLARHYMRPESRPAFPPLVGWAGAVGGLLALSYGLSTYIGVRDLESFVVDNLNFYIEPVNALRVTKGFIAAWLLWPLAAGAGRERAQPMLRLAQGLGLGAGILGLVALWELGFFRAVAAGSDLYTVVDTVLDFSNSYRATGLFSAMHVGGTAIDGYLVLAVPMALAAAVATRQLWMRLLFVGAFGLGLYAAMTTFSRGLYGGMAVAILSFAVFYGTGLSKRDPAVRRLLPGIVLGAVGGLILFIFAYRWGGFESLLETVILLIAGGLVGRYLRADGRLLLAAGICLALLGAVLLGESFAESRWTTLTDGMVYPAALGLAALAVAAGWRIGLVTQTVSMESLVLTGALFVLLAAVAVPALSGYRMNVRFSQSESDLQTREDHWSQALAIMRHNGNRWRLGNGVGRYPAYYFWTVLGNETLPTAAVGEDSGGSFLRLGVGDFSVMQRVSVQPGQDYMLSGEVRSPDGGRRLGLALCHKNILFTAEYRPECVRDRVSVPPDGQWHPFTLQLHVGDLGQYGLLYWPVNVILKNGDSHGVVDVTNLVLSAGSGKMGLIANPDFSAGVERWLLVSDVNHLPWHTKNLFLQLFFEQGVLGLAAFLAALALGLVRQVRATWAGGAVAAGFAATLAGFVVVAVFGSVIDNPTVALVVYLVLLTACSETAQPRPAQDRPAGDFPVDNPPARRHL